MDRLMSVLLWPLHFAMDCHHRYQFWLHTRPWPLLLFGLPALIVAPVVTGIIVYEWTGMDSVAVDRYRFGAAQAVEREDIPAARIYAKKLSELAPDEPASIFALARLAEFEGDLGDAAARISALAPADAMGYPDAHFWAAKFLLKNRRPLRPVDVALVMHHLHNAIESDTHRRDAHALMAKIELARGQYEQSIKHLEAVVRACPEMGIALSIAYSKVGDSIRADSEREDVEEYFSKEVEANPGNVESRIYWAQAVALGGDFEKATQILKTGITLGDESRLHRAIAAIYVDWYDTESAKEDAPLDKRIGLLQSALQHAPTNEKALNRLAVLVGDSEGEGQSSLAALKAMLAAGTLPASVHFILGTGAADSGDWEDAKTHLEQAADQLPETPVLLNNLAWVLAHADPPQAERALRLATTAAKMWPNHPEIRETRGLILMQCERWQEALVDLETALQAFPTRARLHEALATVYEKLGDQELADMHRKRTKPPAGEPEPLSAEKPETAMNPVPDSIQDEVASPGGN